MTMMNEYDKAPNPKHKERKQEHKREMEANANELSDMFVEMTSSLYVLGVKLKGFHWNIVGDQFFPVHAMLDCQIDSVFGFADGAAEIIRQLNIDTPAPVNMITMIKRSVIPETRVSALITAEEFLPIIVSDYSKLIHYCHKVVKISDKAERQDVSDFAIGVRQFLDKYKWQFESAIKK